jgi:hypothetical protein
MENGIRAIELHFRGMENVIRTFERAFITIEFGIWRDFWQLIACFIDFQRILEKFQVNSLFEGQLAVVQHDKKAG